MDIGPGMGRRTVDVEHTSFEQNRKWIFKEEKYTAIYLSNWMFRFEQEVIIPKCHIIILNTI